VHQPAVRSCRAASAPQRIKDALGIDFRGTTEDGQFTLLEGECMGACGDAPVMLVNNTACARSCRRQDRRPAGGTEEMTSLHNRHINPLILKDLDGENWHLADYVKRGGYSGCAVSSKKKSRRNRSLPT
jgi:hypothetical protein